MASMPGVSSKRWPLCVCRRASMTMRCWPPGPLLTSCLSVSTLYISGVPRPWETSQKVLRRCWDTSLRLQHQDGYDRQMPRGLPHSFTRAPTLSRDWAHPARKETKDTRPQVLGPTQGSAGHTLRAWVASSLWRRPSRYFSLMISVS